jgi:hypothetical protein
MKKALVLIAILFFPAIAYVYFALGIPQVIKAPVYGPRHAEEMMDPATGEKRTDTVYYTVPAFSCTTTGGFSFSSEARLDGRLYVAVFLPPDSIKTMLPIMAEDMLHKRNTYGYARFVFFLEGDSAGQPPADAPDVGKDLGLGVDTAYTVFLTPEQFRKVHDDMYVADASRKKDPWQTTTDAVLIDRLGRIRGYYNIRYAADLKKMKEDVNHVLLRDEGVQTIEESTVEQKRDE